MSSSELQLKKSAAANTYLLSILGNPVQSEIHNRAASY